MGNKLNKNQRVFFTSACITFTYLILLMMYAIGALQDVTFGLVILLACIIGSCLVPLYIYVKKNKALIDRICRYEL